MNEIPVSILPLDLYTRLGTASAPMIIDVRPAEDFAGAERLIVGATALLQIEANLVPRSARKCSRGCLLRREGPRSVSQQLAN